MPAQARPFIRSAAVLAGLLLVLSTTLSLVRGATATHTLTVQLAGDGSGGVEVSPMGISTESSLSAGEFHTCAVAADASLACWGDNDDGETDVPPGAYKAVSAGGSYTCAIRLDDTLVCWGLDLDGVLDPPDGSFTAISAGLAHACALAPGASLTCWGDNTWGQTDVPAGSFIAVSAGGEHTCALTTDDTLVCWGENTDGQSDAPAGAYSAIAAGGWHNCAIRTDETLHCWGYNGNGGIEAPAGGFAAVTAGTLHSCGIRTDGSVECWGDTASAPAESPAGAYVLVSAGFDHTCAIRADATLHCWGDDSFDQLSAPAGAFAGDGPTYLAGTVVTLTANAEHGSTFAGWDGDCTGSEPTCQLIMDADRTVTANFELEAEPNTPPLADAGGPYVVDEGSSAQLDASGSTDADGTIAGYAWSPATNLDDASLAQPTFTGVDDAVENLTLTVTDDGGAVDVDTTTVTVHNVAPSVEAGADQAITLGEAVSLDPATFSDPGVLDTHTATIDWGDGSVEPGNVTQGAGSGSVDGTHTYTATGTYIVSVTVTDDDGGSHADSLTVTVNEPPPPTPPNKLLAADGAADDYFGYSVAVSGDRIVVGAYLDDDSGTSSGSAYLFESDGAGGWSQTKLLAADGAAGRGFGYRVAMAGDRIVISAPFYDGSGGVYVFEPDGAGGWSQTKLLASDGSAADFFGSSVAIAGDRIVVGASGSDDNGSGSGSAYVFEADGAGGWSETKLIASDGAGPSGFVDAGDRFGSSVAIAGDRIVVGAFGDDDNGRDSGSAYVFEPDGAGGWSETKLLPSDGAITDFFGESVAVSGDHVVVGASRNDGNGSAYVFEPDGAGGWSETKLLASDGADGDAFGRSVAIAGDRIVVGAQGDDDSGSLSGSAYVFEPDGAGGWSETKLIASDGAASDVFGYSVAISADRVVIGAPLDDDNGSDSGSAYVFEREATDTTAPQITVPGDIVVEATSPDGASIEYEVTVTDDTDPAPSLACEPASGSDFPIGETEVLCTATDASGNVAQATFTVTVTLGAAAFDGLVEIVEELGLRGGTERSIVRQIENAQREFLAGDLDGALEKLHDLVEQVNALEGRRLTEDQAVELRGNLELLITAIGSSGS